MKDFVLVHTDDYGKWVFSENHPTKGRRFINAKNLLLQTATANDYSYEIVKPRRATYTELLEVHELRFIEEVNAGESDEWFDTNPILGDLAFQFAGGTLVALDRLQDGTTKLAINFAGAKHHAQYDHSAGFCVFADFAMTASMLSRDDNKVAILDIDAHHGDGTENLTYNDPYILTYSIHEWGIYPGTGFESDEQFNVYNLPLGASSGDDDLMRGVEDFVHLAEWHKPDYIFIAGGADGHKTDPLSSLQYTEQGVYNAMNYVRRSFPDMPILFGGAGGYQPDTHTPSMWVAMVDGLI